MDKWEYANLRQTWGGIGESGINVRVYFTHRAVLEVGRTFDIMPTVKSLADEGWELVSSLDRSSNKPSCYELWFKRRLP